MIISTPLRNHLAKDLSENEYINSLILENLVILSYCLIIYKIRQSLHLKQNILYLRNQNSHIIYSFTVLPHIYNLKLVLSDLKYINLLPGQAYLLILDS